MEGWEEVPLRAACSIDKTQGMHANLPYVGLEHIESGTSRFMGSLNPQSVKSSTFRFSNEHVLYGRLRPYLNKVLLPDFDGHCSTEIFPLRPSARLDRTFLCYWLSSSSIVAAIDATCTGARMPRASMDKVLDFALRLPPLAEQRRIVAILDEAAEGIATAKANAEKNLQNARQVFQTHLAAAYSTSGEGWTKTTVGASADCCLGKMLDKAKNKGELKPYLRNVNVRWFEFDLSDLQQMRFTTDEHERYSVRRGDVVICEGGYPGRAAIWDDDEPIFIQKALHRVRFADPLLGRWFAYYLYLQQTSGALRQHFTGTGIQHFTGAALSRLNLPLAPLKQMAALVACFDEVAAEVDRLELIYESKLAALDELKRSLLHQAFTGGLS